MGRRNLVEITGDHPKLGLATLSPLKRPLLSVRLLLRSVLTPYLRRKQPDGLRCRPRAPQEAPRSEREPQVSQQVVDDLDAGYPARAGSDAPDRALKDRPAL